MKDDSSEGMPAALVKKNGQVELIRIFCAIAVVFNHMRCLPYGARAVEIFFLLSGFLMMRSMDRYAAEPRCAGADLMRETTFFIWGKVKRIYPELFISMVFAIIAYFVMSPEIVVDKVIESVRMLVGDVCMTRMSGIIYYPDHVNGVTWYIMAMLIGLTFLYPVIRRHGVSLLLFVVCLCIVGYKVRTSVTLVHYWDVEGVTLWGNIRAFAEMGLGACAYPLAKSLAKLPLRRNCKFLCDAVKLVCACALACLILRRGTPYDGHGLFVFFAFVLVVLAFSGQGVLANIFNNKWAYFLGSFSLPLYLSHRCYTLHMRQCFPDGKEYIAAVLACSVITALGVMYGAKLWRKCITVENIRGWFLLPPDNGK